PPAPAGQDGKNPGPPRAEPARPATPGAEAGGHPGYKPGRTQARQHHHRRLSLACQSCRTMAPAPRAGRAGAIAGVPHPQIVILTGLGLLPPAAAYPGPSTGGGARSGGSAGDLAYSTVANSLRAAAG